MKSQLRQKAKGRKIIFKCVQIHKTKKWLSSPKNPQPWMTNMYFRGYHRSVPNNACLWAMLKAGWNYIFNRMPTRPAFRFPRRGASRAVSTPSLIYCAKLNLRHLQIIAPKLRAQGIYRGLCRLRRIFLLVQGRNLSLAL